MKTLNPCLLHLFTSIAAITFASHLLLAQDIAPPRTLPELKEETLKRVQEKPQRSMVEGILVEDAKAALANINTLERDDWAAAWMVFGDKYMAEGKALDAKKDPKAKDLYLRAYKYYKLAHYPTDNSPKKQEA